jgi:transposase
MMILGIDIAQATFDVTLLDAAQVSHYASFANDATGFARLHGWLVQQGVTHLHACMEATNIYWEALAEWLHAQGYTVSVVNPARIKGFALSQLRRNKTDQLDSLVIAQFCVALHPPPWTPPTPQERHLRSGVRHVAGLTKSLTQHKNRLAVCTDPLVRESLQSLITFLDAEIVRLETQLQHLIDNDPDLKERQALLMSIQGIGRKTATTLLAEMYDLAAYTSARAAAADAGVTPAHHESGRTVRRRPHLSKVGKARIRAALYWPALTAIRHNPLIRALADRLRAKGKPKKVILGAAMRKLLHFAYGVLKHRTPFDPAYAA